ncbi:MAG TPA: transcription-repair coupling factor [Actinomycetota bacterium]|nr:transcription-repair coupling factor [Actinomycetota bacterium]
MDAPLTHLVDRLVADPEFTAAATAEGPLLMPDAVRPFALAGLARLTGGCVVAVVPSEPDAEALRAAVAEFCPAAHLPAWDVLPYEAMSPDPRISSRRIQALRMLSHGEGPRVVVAGVRGFIQKPAPGAASAVPVELPSLGTVDRDELVARLVDLGYERTDVAQEPGTFAVRGGIVDVFGAQDTRVARLELFGDEVESLRWVDPESQRSVEDAKAAVIVARTELPPSPELRQRAERAVGRTTGKWLEEVRDRLARLASGVFPEGGESLLPRIWDEAADGMHNLLQSGTPVLLFDVKRASDEAAMAVEQEEELAALWSEPQHVTPDPTNRPPGRIHSRDEQSVLYLPLDRVLQSLRESGTTIRTAGALASDEGTAALDAHPWEPGLSPRTLLERCRRLRGERVEVVFCALPHEVAAVGTRLAEEGLGGAPVVSSSLHGGFVMPSLELAVVTHTEWHARPPAPARPKSRSRPRALEELNPGDLVVHVLHGIGRYVGMETREVAGFTREYLICEYAGGDRLFVPSDTAESLQRYLGGEQPKLSRLGTTEWERTKARVRKKARDIAAELVRLYSARLHSPGHSYPVSSPWQRELEESFPFDETPDQLRAIEEVGRDMARPVPMDRLVCGDVGYGKTEVAVRAAFAAVVEGKQVGVLVPTTLLAQQHFSTFSERFAPFPVNVGLLSRFASPSEIAGTVAKLATKEIDVVIGTHRLLSKDVKFADLGLIIVDEEHRFGVAQKEQLRRMRVEVDVLTLTATPIPRTLEMSMSGIRDLSTIETAPAARRPVRTFVGPFDERLVTAAIRRELARGGQVFFVHNRVQTIERERRRLERLVPEARIAVGHGQMDEHELERVMVSFWRREVDVLLCTTIIEAGLDIPSSNTLIVDRADMLGLAQLYQLRGRVGRAGEQAYAYLFFPPNLRLTGGAHERLKTLAQYTELGSGMAIAMKDLEIRGAGNLLGADQHGHIEAVGFEMYVQLLEEAARELKGEPPAKPPEVRMDLPVDAFLPADWIDSEPLRLAAYRRIADTVAASEIQDVRSELRDRFGPLPDPAAALLRVAELRASLRSLGITDLSVTPNELHGRVAKIKPVALTSDWQRVRLARKYPRAVLSEATSTLVLPVPDLDGTQLLDWLEEATRGLLERDAVPA